LTPALTARKFGTIHRIRLVCCPSSGFAAVEVDDELVGEEGLCPPAGTGEGVGASGMTAAATSPRGGSAGNSKPALSYAVHGARANTKIAPLITNRVDSPILIKSTPSSFERKIVWQTPTRMFDVAPELWFYLFLHGRNQKPGLSPLSGGRQSTLVLSASCPFLKGFGNERTSG
jgi:hypothetical protein